MIDLKIKIPDLSAAFKKHQHDIMMGLAASMQTNRSMMFDKDGADNGKPKWAPLKIRKGGRPLQHRGYLRKSFAPIPSRDGSPGHGPSSILRFEGTRVVIGSTLLYAGMMNDGTTKMPGGKLVPVRAQALKIPLMDGSFMFRRSVKIPARQMNTISDQDKIEFAETMENHIIDILSRAE